MVTTTVSDILGLAGNNIIHSSVQNCITPLLTDDRTDRSTNHLTD